MFDNIYHTQREIPSNDHHCGGETFQSMFQAYSAENTLKSLSSTVMNRSLFRPLDIIQDLIWLYFVMC